MFVLINLKIVEVGVVWTTCVNVVPKKKKLIEYQSRSNFNDQSSFSLLIYEFHIYMYTQLRIHWKKNV